MRIVVSMVIGSLLLPALAAAQQARPARGTVIGASAGARVFRAAPSMRVTGSGRVRRMQTTGVEFSSFQTFPTFPVSFDNVPGLGFDFPHLAAVTRGQPRHRPIFEPIGFPGIFFSPLAEPPTVVIVQQPAAVEVPEYPASYVESVRDNDSDFVPERVPARRESTSARAAPQPQTPPLEPAPAAQQDSAQYVFVQRDGSLLFAVAYSWEKGMLRYITPEGLRRSVGRDKLDLEATQQFNEQRGLIFRSPV